MPSRRDDACAIMGTDDRATAVHSVVNLHPVAIDGANLSIRTNHRRSATQERHLPSGERPIHCVRPVRHPAIGIRIPDGPVCITHLSRTVHVYICSGLPL